MDMLILKIDFLQQCYTHKYICLYLENQRCNVYIGVGYLLKLLVQMCCMYLVVSKRELCSDYGIGEERFSPLSNIQHSCFGDASRQLLQIRKHFMGCSFHFVRHSGLKMENITVNNVCTRGEVRLKSMFFGGKIFSYRPQLFSGPVHSKKIIK